jgi:3-deoxy-D-manno-octulosonate 8-phosphate phosphatase (KDO 8-P phosphatase)
MFENTDSQIIALAKNIRLLVLDVDGVLSDGKLYFSNSGDEIKTFNSLDGHGIKMLQKYGVQVAIITGRTSNIVQKRAKDLGINLLIQGREDKRVALDELLETNPVELNQIAYMGDDLPDLAAIRSVGLGMCPSNAHAIVKEHSQWQSQYKGGEGAVREACDLILHAQDLLGASVAPYL